MPSRINIKNKITFSFVALLILMSTTAIIAYLLVQQVERKLYRVEIIDGFLNLTLELRRYEKNYFLYHLDEDYFDNVQYLDRLDGTVIEHEEIFSASPAGIEAEQVDTVLGSYRKKMDQLYVLDHEGKAAAKATEGEQLQNDIRDSGKKLTLIAEQMANRERESIQKLLETSRTVLLSSTGTVIIISILMAMFLREKIVSSHSCPK